MDKNSIKGSAELFLYKAEIDLNTARYLLEGFNDGKLEIDLEKICFELQQSSEKLFKALLSKNNMTFPKSHDLEILIKICCQSNIKLIESVEQLIDLSEYAVQGRYAIIHDDLDSADEYIAIIEKLFDFTKKIVFA